MEVPHQVDDRVDVGASTRTLDFEKVASPARVLVVERFEPGRVDQRDPLQFRRRPPNVQVGNVGFGQVTEIDVERILLPDEAQLTTLTIVQPPADDEATRAAYRALQDAGSFDPRAHFGS